MLIIFLIFDLAFRTKLVHKGVIWYARHFLRVFSVLNKFEVLVLVVTVLAG